jgi:hypothetical protein
MERDMQTIPFGTHARDVITGFSGIIIGHTSYITGCDQYLVQPTYTKDGEVIESRWFDVSRLTNTNQTVDSEITALAALDHAATSTPRGADKPAARK